VRKKLGINDVQSSFEENLVGRKAMGKEAESADSSETPEQEPDCKMVRVDAED